MELIQKIKGYFKSVYVVLFRDIKKPFIFSGYCNYYFANLYRMKREFMWRKYWNQMGKEQFILKFMPGKLLVCSKLELEAYRKMGLISKDKSIRKITKASL